MQSTLSGFPSSNLGIIAFEKNLKYYTVYKGVSISNSIIGADKTVEDTSHIQPRHISLLIFSKNSSQILKITVTRF